MANMAHQKIVQSKIKKIAEDIGLELPDSDLMDFGMKCYELALPSSLAEHLVEDLFSANPAAKAALVKMVTESLERFWSNSMPNLTAHICGPQSAACKCNCPTSCEHKWDGPTITFETEGGGGGATSTCSRCGMDAMAHDMWVLP